MPATGFAICRDFRCEGFDFIVPQQCPRRVLRYLDALAEGVVLPGWRREIELAVARRVLAGGSPGTTRADVDRGFSALVNSLGSGPRPQFLYLVRRPGLRYGVPATWPPEVRRHFSEQVRHFMNVWATEIEQLRDDPLRPVHRRATVDRALSAAAEKVISLRRPPDDEPGPRPRPRRRWFRRLPRPRSEVVEFTLLDRLEKGDPFFAGIPLGPVGGSL